MSQHILGLKLGVCLLLQLQCPDGKLTHQELCEQCKVLYRRSKPDKFCQYLISSLDKDGDQVLK